MGHLRYHPRRVAPRCAPGEGSRGRIAAVSDAWALLVSKLRASGRKAPLNDSWIAATAIAHQIPVLTQDSDYDDLPDLEVIKVGSA